MPLSYCSYDFQTAAYYKHLKISLRTPFSLDKLCTMTNFVFLGVNVSIGYVPIILINLFPILAHAFFLATPFSQSAYRCLNLSSNRLFLSRYVQFDDFIFPFFFYKPNDPYVSFNSLTTCFSFIPQSHQSLFYMTQCHTTRMSSHSLQHRPILKLHRHLLQKRLALLLCL